MKFILIAAAGGLLATTALPVTAQQSPPRPAPTQPTPAPAQGHMAPGHAMPPGQTMAPQTRPAPPPSPNRPQTSPGHGGSGPRPYQAEAGGMHGGEMSYGRWDNGWGARPSAPPAHFTRHNDWYRHVRACQQRYKSYNPRTDMFVPRRGHSARCTL